MRWILFFLLFSSLLNAQENEFSADLKILSREISIDQTLQVDLVLGYPLGFQPNYEGILENVSRSSNFYGRSFSLKEMKPGNINKTDSGLSQNITLILRPLKTGLLYLTLYDVNFFKTGDPKTKYNVLTEIIPLQVSGISNIEGFTAKLAPLMTFQKSYPLSVDLENIEDQKRQTLIQNNELVEIKQIPWIEILTLSLILLIFWIFIKNPPAPVVLTKEQKIQRAREKALEAIQKLQPSQTPDKSFFEPFYIELTQPLREFIQEKYNLPAITLTTPEFLKQARNSSSFSEEERKNLNQILILADKVKFGLLQPTSKDCDQAKELVVQFISNK
jgi:hypothetical protein